MTTIRDIARLAKVSTATVSRTLNGDAKVKPETALRITNIAAQLRFVPSNAARSLITRKTETIGVLLPDLHGEFFSELIRGIDQAARGKAFHLLVSSSHGDVYEAEAAIKSMAGRVDGLLVMSPHLNSEFLTSKLPLRLPTVLMNTRIADSKLPSFIVDNYGGSYSMMRHLVRQGHKQIAMIAGPEKNFEAQERLRGYRDALKEFLPKSKEQIWLGDFTEESGWKVGAQVISMRSRPDAIFAANDMMAIGCLSTLTDAGLKVPDDIALVGYDDIPTSRFISPPLTTVRVRISEMGSLAFQSLVAIIEDVQTQNLDQNIEPHILRTELVIRSSCGAKNP
ncbi:MAG: LacI family DNA-binding transcriptional regulator [Burkholderiales bacterium]|nr:LacI family DNA-binding transcriptional regulator [Burkholderiales bacterium]